MARAAIERQVQWFAGADNGIASMAMRDDTDSRIERVLPLWQVLGHPCRLWPRDVVRSSGAASEPWMCISRETLEPPAPIAHEGESTEVVAVHAPARDGQAQHAVSCCALCELGSSGSGRGMMMPNMSPSSMPAIGPDDGTGAAIGSLDGIVQLVDLRRRTHVGSVNVGAPIARLLSLPADDADHAAANSLAAAEGTASSTPARPGGHLIVRTLQGSYSLISLAPPYSHRKLALPPGELSLQLASRGSKHGPLLLLHCIEECRLLVYTAPSLLGAGAMVAANSHRHRPLFVFSLPPSTLPGSIHLGPHTILCARDTPPQPEEGDAGGEAIPQTTTSTSSTTTSTSSSSAAASAQLRERSALGTGQGTRQGTSQGTSQGQRASQGNTTATSLAPAKAPAHRAADVQASRAPKTARAAAAAEEGAAAALPQGLRGKWWRRPSSAHPLSSACRGAHRQ